MTSTTTTTPKDIHQVVNGVCHGGPTPVYGQYHVQVGGGALNGANPAAAAAAAGRLSTSSSLSAIRVGQQQQLSQQASSPENNNNSFNGGNHNNNNNAGSGPYRVVPPQRAVTDDPLTSRGCGLGGVASPDNGGGTHHVINGIATTSRTPASSGNGELDVDASPTTTTAADEHQHRRQHPSSSLMNPHHHQQQQQPTTSQQTAPLQRCAACGREIADRFLLHAIDRYWHTECLRCSACQAPLADLGSTCFTRAGMTLCRSDYIRMFGLTGTCRACRQPIPPNEFVMKTQQDCAVYHVTCFACVTCQCRLVPGDRYGVVAGRLVCEQDYVKAVKNQLHQHHLQQQQQQPHLQQQLQQPSHQLQQPTTPQQQQQQQAQVQQQRVDASTQNRQHHKVC